MQGHQALNHIYKDLVSIVITQSTDKGWERGRKECVFVCACVCACVTWACYIASCAYSCVCVSGSGSICVYLSVYICVYPCEEKRKGIIFSLAQVPVHVCVCG